jgi:hypothetical protein
MKPQPSEELEAENAAYVWLEACQKDLAKAAKAETYATGAHEEIAWCFERYSRALAKHQALEAARRAGPSAAGGADA